MQIENSQRSLHNAEPHAYSRRFRKINMANFEFEVVQKIEERIVQSVVGRKSIENVCNEAKLACKHYRKAYGRGPHRVCKSYAV